MLNKVILIGHLGKDPEIKQFDNGSIANFTMATNESYKDKSGNRVDKTEWHNITVGMPSLVDLVQKYFKKGDPIYVEGKLQTREYEKEGQKHYMTQIKVDTIKFLPKSNSNNSTAENSAPRTEASSSPSTNENFITEVSQVDDDLPF